MNGDYGRWWNVRHQRVGHVFQGRFKDQIVQQEGYLESLCGYIARNPVRAGLVTDPATWRWSAYRALAGLAPCPGFLRHEFVLSRFGDETATQRTAYVAHVLSRSAATDAADERIRSKEWILGDATFKRTVTSEAGTTEQDARTRLRTAGTEPLVLLA